MKVTRVEIKNNLQGNSSRVNEAENQITYLEHKKAKNNQSKEWEEKRIHKKRGEAEEPLGQLQTYQCSNHRRRVKEWEIENLVEKIMKENFLNLVKEIDIQVQEAQRISKRWTQRGPHQDTS